MSPEAALASAPAAGKRMQPQKSAETFYVATIKATPIFDASQRKMKSAPTQKKLPATAADWEKLIAAAPCRDRRLAAKKDKQIAGVAAIKGGGYAKVQATLAERRERSPQVARAPAGKPE